MKIRKKIKDNLFWITGILIMLCMMLPVYLYAYFTVPLADDFGMAISAAKAWQESKNIFAVLKAAADWSVLCYETWSGEYICMFLQCLPIGLGDFGTYYLSAWLIISIYIFSVYYAGKVFFVDYLHGERKTWFFASSIIFIFMTQFLPDLYDAFFWYTTAISYTLSFSVKLILVAAVFKVLFVEDDVKIGIRIFLILGCFLAAGFECSFTHTTFFLVISAFAVFCIYFNEKRRYTCICWLVTAIGWGVALLAPGNMVRQEENYEGTVGGSFYYLGIYA